MFKLYVLYVAIGIYYCMLVVSTDDLYVLLYKYTINAVAYVPIAYQALPMYYVYCLQL